ncbi:MAG: hypothetical protein HOI79_04125 [Euryarchaeota archaeon]|jgi:hypothetical protein|nr:hypothetical protein [Euryarchaeota archaeon]
MPACRHCGSTYPREFFIHGNGPRAQVCAQCGLDQGLVTKEEVPILFEKQLANARFSTVTRRYSIFLYIPFLWALWGFTLSDVKPWGLFFLGLLIVLTLLAPVIFIYRGGRYSGDMARLSPAYDRPKGH